MRRRPTGRPGGAVADPPGPDGPGCSGARPSLAAAAVLATSVLLMTGCSGSDAPTDAAQEDFCTVFNTLGSAESAADFREFAGDLERVGTPADISDDGRGGFDVVIRVARGLDTDATLDELEDPDVSAAEEQEAQVFVEYGSRTCGSIDEQSGP